MCTNIDHTRTQFLIFLVHKQRMYEGVNLLNYPDCLPLYKSNVDYLLNSTHTKSHAQTSYGRKRQ